MEIQVTDATNPELLPCPFCGSPAEWEYTPWHAETEIGDDGMGRIECTGCHVQTVVDDRDAATARWNKRRGLSDATH